MHKFMDKYSFMSHKNVYTCIVHVPVQEIRLKYFQQNVTVNTFPRLTHWLTLWLIDLKKKSKIELPDLSNYVQMDEKTSKNAKIMKVTHLLTRYQKLLL